MNTRIPNNYPPNPPAVIHATLKTITIDEEYPKVLRGFKRNLEAVLTKSYTLIAFAKDAENEDINKVYKFIKDSTIELVHYQKEEDMIRVHVCEVVFKNMKEDELRRMPLSLSLNQSSATRAVSINFLPSQPPGVISTTLPKSDTVSKDSYSVYIDDKTSSFTTEYKKRFTDAFFQQYARLAATYNSNSPKLVRFFVDKSYTGIAEASGNTIRFNPAWFEKNPEDIDVITHELMHLVQNYNDGKVPGWVTEGIADYVRATEGINNEKAKWALPELKPEHRYTNAYRVTARFFVWISQRYRADFVKKLDEACRNKNYSDAIWKSLTGKTVEDLWKEYVADPAIRPMTK